MYDSMTVYQKFKELNIDHSAIGLDLNISNMEYFCTPKGAKVIAEAGVDGIHYCFIEGFDFMVFAISPSALPGENVHPIANNFEDLLKLLLSCGSMDAIEQTYMWDEELFNEYVMDNQPLEKQRSILDLLEQELLISPMEQPFAYLKELQKSFDYSKLEFSEEYYQLLPADEIEEHTVPEWKVTYDGGFYGKRGKSGKEINFDKEFEWANEKWHVPAAYLCSKGMVMDYCIEIDTELIKAYIQKWDLYNENSRNHTHDQQEQMYEENPLNIEFHSVITVNGSEMEQRQGCAVYWIPRSCMPDDIENETEAKWILNHYGYDLDKAWAIHRISYPWTDRKPRTVKSLELKLERKKVKIPGETFIVPEAGYSFSFVNPVTKKQHTCIIRELEEGEMDPNRFQNDDMEWPTHYTAMSYTIFPEMEEFTLSDCCQGDSPRRKEISADGPSAAFVGVIGVGARTKNEREYYHPDGTLAKLRNVCSGLYFVKPEKIEWKFTFREKQVPDIRVTLI